MVQITQVLGALLVLTAFTAAQRGAVSQRSRTYLILNLVGSVLLAVIAASEKQVGFLLLEGSWALVSARSLARSVRSMRDQLHLAKSPSKEG